MKLMPNKIVGFLILGDLAFWSGWGLINPIFAFFISARIEATPEKAILVAGIASAVFWITRSIFRIPAGMLVDICPSEKDDYFVLMVGFFLASLVPFGYILAKTPFHIYALQAVHGLALALAYAGWTGIFTRHIDKGRESTDWGLNATSIGLGTGVAGAVGGWAVSAFGFQPVFVTVGVLSFVSVIILLGLRNEIGGVFNMGANVHFKDIFFRNGKGSDL